MKLVPGIEYLTAPAVITSPRAKLLPKNGKSLTHLASCANHATEHRHCAQSFKSFEDCLTHLPTCANHATEHRHCLQSFKSFGHCLTHLTACANHATEKRHCLQSFKSFEDCLTHLPTCANHVTENRRCLQSFKRSVLDGLRVCLALRVGSAFSGTGSTGGAKRYFWRFGGYFPRGKWLPAKT
jgi:hypothetical protein